MTSAPATPNAARPAGRAPQAPLRARVVGRRYHFHLAVVAYSVTTFVLVMGAVKSQNNLLFWLFGLAVAGLIVSGLLSGAALMGVRIERDVPERGAVGHPLKIRYRLRSRNRFFPALALVVEELPGHGASWEGAASSGERLWSFAARVAPGHDTLCECEVTPSSRGIARFRRLRVSTTFPFGLARKSVTFEQQDEVLIRPAVATVPVATLDALSGRGTQGFTERRGRSGEEFFGLRPFTPGDSARSVAWRPSARSGNLVVRERATRPDHILWVALREPPESADRAGERVISTAAGLVELALRRGLAVGLTMESGGVLEGPGTGTRHLERVLDGLAHLPRSGWVAGEAPRDAIQPVVVHAGGGLGGRTLGADEAGIDLPQPSPVAGPVRPASWWRSLLGDGE